MVELPEKARQGRVSRPGPRVTVLCRCPCPSCTWARQGHSSGNRKTEARAPGACSVHFHPQPLISPSQYSGE